MSQKLIRKMFESRLNTWAAARSPQLSIDFENENFQPPAGTYLRAFLLPAPIGSQDLLGDHRLYTGFFQVSIVTDRNAGAGVAEGIVDELETLFPVNLRLTDSGVTVLVRTPMSPATPIQEPDKYVVPVSCQYRADTI